jgi:HrpA-like RNA helicase
MNINACVGEKMSNLPLDPSLSRMLLEAYEDGLDCVEEVK